MKRRTVQGGALCLALVLTFGWGYLSHRNRVFPYPQARSLAAWAGWAEAPEPERHEVWRDPAALGALEALPYVQGLPDPEPELAGVLITETDSGYAFEVTPSGKRVWVFANPEVDEDGVRMSICRMARLQRDEVPFLRHRLGDG